MSNVKYSLFFSIFLMVFTFPLTSQSTMLESSKVVIEQRLGYGTVTVEYYRPNVNGRNIWGFLVPFNEVWRTGANYPTFITFSDTTYIENEMIPNGKYSLYTIPREDEWTIILSGNTTLWGAYGYNEKDDVLRVKVKPRVTEFMETFTIGFDNVMGHEAVFSLKWEKLKIPIRMSVHVFQKLIHEVDKKSREGKADWGTYNFAAKYMITHNVHLEKAGEWMARSLKMEKNWMNLWTMASFHSRMNDFISAIEYGEQALEDCKSSQPYCPYAITYSDRIAIWKEKKK